MPDERTDGGDAREAGPRKRVRWGRWVAAAVVLLLVVAPAVHWWSGRSARGRLLALVEQYRRAGEPMYLGDFAVAPVAPFNNAAPDLRAAASSFDPRNAAWQNLQELNVDLPLTAEEQALTAKVLADRAGLLARVRAARGKPAVDWQLPTPATALDLFAPDLGPQRGVADVLALDVLYQHHRGNDAEAVERARDVRFVGRAVAAAPSLIAWLISDGISAVASDRLIRIAPDLRVGGAESSGGAAAGGGTPAAAEQVRQLISELLDDAPARAAARHGFRGERAFQLDTALGFGEGRLMFNAAPGGPPGRGPSGRAGPGGAEAAVSYALRPWFLGDGERLVRHTSGVITALDAPDWPAARAALPTALPQELARNPGRHMLARMLAPGSDRAAEQFYRETADRRLAATALAVRLYALDHAGQFPAKLDDLVPAYLPAVPLDPMASRQPLRYAPDADRPIVYSVGTNGADDGGSELPLKPGTSPPNRTRWDEQDAVVHLKRQPRKAAPKEEGNDGLR